MNTKNIHSLIGEASMIEDNQARYVANKLLCCVLDIAEKEGRFSRSSYFWEKAEKAFGEIGVQIKSMKKD